MAPLPPRLLAAAAAAAAAALISRRWPTVTRSSASSLGRSLEALRGWDSAKAALALRSTEAGSASENLPRQHFVSARQPEELDSSSTERDRLQPGVAGGTNNSQGGLEKDESRPRTSSSLPSAALQGTDSSQLPSGKRGLAGANGGHAAAALQREGQREDGAAGLRWPIGRALKLGRGALPIDWLAEVAEPALQLYRRAFLRGEPGGGQGTALASARALLDVARSMQQSSAGMERWSLADLTLGLYMLSVRHAAEGALDSVGDEVVSDRDKVKALLYHVELAKGAKSRDAAGLARATMLREARVLKLLPKSDVMQPAYYIAVDDRCQLVVLGIRGTSTAHDIFTNIASHSVKMDPPRAARGSPPRTPTTGHLADSEKLGPLGVPAESPGAQHLSAWDPPHKKRRVGMSVGTFHWAESLSSSSPPQPDTQTVSLGEGQTGGQEATAMGQLDASLESFTDAFRKSGGGGCEGTGGPEELGQGGPWAEGVESLDPELPEGYSHQGMTEAARWLLHREAGTLREVLAANPGYSLRLVGHSLGGAVASLLAIMLRPQSERLLGIPPERVTCVGVATPPCVSRDLAVASCPYITTLVLQDDVIPRLSTAALDRLRTEILLTDWTAMLEEEKTRDQMATLASSTLQALSSVQKTASSQYEAWSQSKAKLGQGQSRKARPEVTARHLRPEESRGSGLARAVGAEVRELPMPDEDMRSVSEPGSESGSESGSDTTLESGLDQSESKEEAAVAAAAIGAEHPQHLVAPGQLFHLVRRPDRWDAGHTPHDEADAKGPRENARQRKSQQSEKGGPSTYVLVRGSPEARFERIVLSASMFSDHRCDNHYYALREVLKSL